jgi:hypothetical protein
LIEWATAPRDCPTTTTTTLPPISRASQWASWVGFTLTLTAKITQPQQQNQHPQIR